jgi:hypothetical protein
MFDLPKFKKALIYQKPISMRWGENKLAALYEQHHGIKPQIGVALLFYNARRDCLKLFFHDALGASELQKTVPRGGFMLPAPIAGQDFLEISPSLITRLFRG